MKILIADDDSISRYVLEMMLTEWGYEVVSVKNGAEAWKVLQSANAAKLAILDWVMPEMNGTDVCRAVRKRGAEPYAYIILLTSKDQPEDIATGIESGADDYLAKPFNALELNARLRAGRRIIELQDELIAARERLREQVMHDSLTGAWSRRAIWEMLEMETSRSWRENRPIAVLMADIDYFKRINDEHGHFAGDMVLQETVKRMNSCLRAYSGVGRYGGEEILQGCDIKTAAQIAERVRLSVSSLPFETGDRPINVTISIGASAIIPAKHTNPAALVNEADSALYRAKQNGRNRVETA